MWSPNLCEVFIIFVWLIAYCSSLVRETVSISCLLPFVDTKLLNPFTFVIGISEEKRKGKEKSNEAQQVCAWLVGLDVFHCIILPPGIIKPELPFLQSNPVGGRGDNQSIKHHNFRRKRAPFFKGKHSSTVYLRIELPLLHSSPNYRPWPSFRPSDNPSWSCISYHHPQV